MSEKRRTPSERWTTAGVAVVALAALLAGFGLYFAVSWTRLTAATRIDRLREEAGELKTAAGRSLRETINQSIRGTARALRSARRGEAPEVPGLPAWIMSAFLWDGRDFQSWVAPPFRGDAALDSPDLRDRVKTQMSDFRDSAVAGLDFGTRFQQDDVGRPILLACRVEGAFFEDPLVAAVLIDLHGLKLDYLDPQFTASGRLHVVTDDAGRAGNWREPVAAFLGGYFVEPSPAFVAAERRRFVAQIAAYALVAVVFVVALIIMMHKFIRLVQREVALSRLKSNFVADVSHELKTPLALIRMFSEMLGENRVPTDEKKHEYYGIITRESARLTHMIDNILDFARIDAGRKQYTFQTIDIARVVTATYDAYRFDLDRQGFKHRLAVNGELPAIQADPDAVSQAVLNLISNAMKYSDDEKELVIELSKETRRGKHGVLISLSDRGIGIKPEDRSHLFDGFFRADDDRVRRRRGAGLGLSLVRSIVEAHGGSIDIESRLVKGSTFRIFLPQSAPVEIVGR